MILSQDLMGCRVVNKINMDELGIIVGSRRSDVDDFDLLILEDDGRIRSYCSDCFSFAIHEDDLPLLRKNLRATMERRSRMKEEQITREQLIDLED